MALGFGLGSLVKKAVGGLNVDKEKQDFKSGRLLSSLKRRVNGI